MPALNSIKTTHVPDSRRANRAEAAEFFGVSQNTIQNWMQRGCPYLVRGSPGTPWVFDLLAIAKWRYGAEDDSDGEDPEQMSPKDRLDFYKGCRERDLHKKEAGELLHVDEVTAGWSSIIAIAKGRLLALPMRLAPKLVGISSMRETEAAIKDGIVGVLEELSLGD